MPNRRGTEITRSENDITVTLHERHGTSNHGHIDCLFNSLFKLATVEKDIKLRIISLYEENPIPFTKGQ